MKKRWGKLFALALGASMVFNMAACGSKTDDKPSQSKTSTSTSSTKSTMSTASASKTTSSASKTSETNSGEIVNLKWVQVGSGQPDNYDAWKENINKYLGEKIGVNIDVEVVSWGDWDSRRSTLVNTGGDYDIMFTNANTYVQDVKMGAFLDITDLLKDNAPSLVSSMPEDYWNATRVDGQIYAVPTYKDSSMTFYFIFVKKLLDKYGIDANSLKTLEDLTEPLKKIKKGENEAPLVLNKEGVSNSLGKEYDSMGLPALGVKYSDSSKKLVPIFEQEDVMKELKLLHQWYKDGLINPDAATLAEKPKYRPFGIEQGWSGAAKTVWGPNMGEELVAVPWGDTLLSNVTVGGSLNCISASCEHPDKALQFLELVNTDTYVRDSFFYGLEGEKADWTYTADKKVHKNNDEWKMAGYTQGSYFIVSQRDDVDFNQWDEVKELNAKAKPSPVLGINLNVSEFEDEMVNCVEIYNKYKSELFTGTKDPEVLVKSMMEEMRKAGFDDMMQKAQAQIDAVK